MTYLRAIVLILAMSASNIAHAQYCTDAKVSESVLQKGSLTSSFANENGGVEFDVSSEGSVATAKVFNSLSSKANDCKNPDYFESRNLSLSVSSPLGDGNTSRTLATLDGVSTGPSVTVEFGIGRTFDFTNPGEIVQKQREGIEIAHTMCLEKKRSQPALTCKKPDINKDDPQSYIASHAPSFYSKSLTSKAKTFWVRSEATLGYDNLNYLDVSDLSSQNTDVFQYNLGLSATYVSFERNGALTGGIEYQSSFDEADEAIICLPNSDMTDPVNCASGRPEEPTRDTKWIGSLEYRYLLNEFDIAGRNLGFAPRLTYDFEDNTTGVSLPIFLSPKDSSDVSTGLNLGWRDDTDDLTVGIFIGGAFNLIQ